MSDEELDLIEIQLDVAERFHGWRIDRFVQARIPRLSRTRIQQMLRAQEQLGGEVLRPAMRVRAGQRLILLRPAPDEPDVPRHFEVLYEDEFLIAIDKPAGLPVHATARYHRNTLTAVLRERYAAEEQVPRLVHRIDRETSGVLLLARRRDVESALKQALAARSVHKAYLAITWGDPGPSGMIDAPIGPDPESGIRVKMRARADGLPSRTRYRRLAVKGGYALVEAYPETGRQHQIRVHLASLGTPIVGDKLYGPDPSCMLEHLETGWTEALAARLELPRHALHAARICFEHPVHRKSMTVESPFPGDLDSFWCGRR
ncbi:MAG: RluA family pseudouridine synthase [Deltaproteobacteria bacterium]|nr:RluA family pseudouridine synthase [Deltaproteobacteria bacterium]